MRTNALSVTLSPNYILVDNQGREYFEKTQKSLYRKLVESMILYSRLITVLTSRL